MTSPIAIDDPSDPRIAAYRAIRERDLVGREGLFIAEGEVVVRMLLRSSIHAPVSLLLPDRSPGCQTKCRCSPQVRQ